MPQYEVELTIKFFTSQTAGKFVKWVEAEMGYAADREGSTVTCFVYRHGDEIVVSEKAEELGGEAWTKVLKDTE